MWKNDYLCQSYFKAKFFLFLNLNIHHRVYLKKSLWLWSFHFEINKNQIIIIFHGYIPLN